MFSPNGHLRSWFLHLHRLCVSTFLPPVPRRGFALRTFHTAAPRVSADGLRPQRVTWAGFPTLGHVSLAAVPRYHEGSDSRPEFTSPGGSPLLLLRSFLAFHPQPQSGRGHRFDRHHQRDHLIPGFAMNEEARRTAPPKRVRFTTDRKFASGCSPPRLTATQLPSATGLWLTPARTLTMLLRAIEGALIPAKAGIQGSRFGLRASRAPHSSARR